MQYICVCVYIYIYIYVLPLSLPASVKRNWAVTFVPMPMPKIITVVVEHICITNEYSRVFV